jgi:hypothetical protein
MSTDCALQCPAIRVQLQVNEMVGRTLPARFDGRSLPLFPAELRQHSPKLFKSRVRHARPRRIELRELFERAEMG